MSGLRQRPRLARPTPDAGDPWPVPRPFGGYGSRVTRPTTPRGFVTTVNQPLRGSRNEFGPGPLGPAPAQRVGSRPGLHRAGGVRTASTSRCGPMRWISASICAWGGSTSSRPTSIRSSSRTPASRSPIPRSPRSSSHHGSGRSRSVGSVQAVWTMGNVAALVGVLVLSVRLVKPSLDRVATWRLALALSLPALLLNPVLITIGFGQVNLFVTFLVMWDLLSERRIGKRQLPLGVATGLAAAVKLTPLLFVPYLVLTRRWRGALTAVLTFVRMRAGDLRRLAGLLEGLLDQGHLQARSRRATSRSSTTRTSGASSTGSPTASSPMAVMLPLLVVTAAAGLLLAAQAHRRSSPLLGVLICAATCLLVSPISWVHHLVWVVPAILWLALAPDRPRWGPVLAGATAVLFWSAPVWWVPYKNTSDLHLDLLAAGCRELVLLRHAALPRRRARCSCSARVPAWPRRASCAPDDRSRELPQPARPGLAAAPAPVVRPLCVFQPNCSTRRSRRPPDSHAGRGGRGGSGGIRHPAPFSPRAPVVNRPGAVRPAAGALTPRRPVLWLEGGWGPGWRG